jgi:hypothetical protein
MKAKGKGRAMKYLCRHREEAEVYPEPIHNLGARRGWSAPSLGRFTSGKDPVPIVQKAGWASGPVWTDTENLAAIGIPSPDHPARIKPLYRLRY